MSDSRPTTHDKRTYVVYTEEQVLYMRMRDSKTNNITQITHTYVYTYNITEKRQNQNTPQKMNIIAKLVTYHHVLGNKHYI